MELIKFAELFYEAVGEDTFRHENISKIYRRFERVGLTKQLTDEQAREIARSHSEEYQRGYNDSDFQEQGIRGLHSSDVGF